MNENKKQYKSYSEIIKAYHNKKIAQKEKSVLYTYIQMVFDEAIINHRLKTYEEEINAALDSKDEMRFLEISAKYNELKKALL